VKNFFHLIENGYLLRFWRLLKNAYNKIMQISETTKKK
jgi:hypothetical protein